jgi:hypothetical protein
MTPTVVAIVTFACLVGATIAGIVVGRVLPDHHLSSESKDVVKLGIGLIATMAALVLGLMTASAKSSFDAEDRAVKTTAADVLLLDRVLASYGPEVKETRETLRQGLVQSLNAIWPEDGTEVPKLEVSGVEPPINKIETQLRMLSPQNESQRWLQSRALQVLGDLQQTRWLALAAAGHSVLTPFVVIVVFWLAAIFGGFGLFAPPNVTVGAVLVICAASVATAIFLILEMEGAFSGLLKVSSAPLSYALAHLGQ